MSHDRKPGRARVIKPGDETPQRRRNDEPFMIVDGKKVPGTRKAGRGGGILLTALFLLAVVGGAVGGALYLP